MGKGWYSVIDYDIYMGHMVCSNMCRHGGMGKLRSSIQHSDGRAVFTFRNGAEAGTGICRKQRACSGKFRISCLL